MTVRMLVLSAIEGRVTQGGALLAPRCLLAGIAYNREVHTNGKRIFRTSCLLAYGQLYELEEVEVSECCPYPRRK